MAPLSIKSSKLVDGYRQWKPPSWQAARYWYPTGDGREESQQAGRRDGCASETGCSRWSAGQLLLLACGFDIR
jgi:hypothetical protein